MTYYTAMKIKPNVSNLIKYGKIINPYWMKSMKGYIAKKVKRIIKIKG